METQKCLQSAVQDAGRGLTHQVHVNLLLPLLVLLLLRLEGFLLDLQVDIFNAAFDLPESCALQVHHFSVVLTVELAEEVLDG